MKPEIFTMLEPIQGCGDMLPLIQKEATRILTIQEVNLINGLTQKGFGVVLTVINGMIIQ